MAAGTSVSPRPRAAVVTAGLGLMVWLSACASSGSEPPRNPAAYVDGQTYVPAFDAANFSNPQPNSYFPLEPGTQTIFEGETEHVEVTVTNDTKIIEGIRAVVVTDQVFVEGQLTEDTLDWYAADNFGNVWYLGEQTAEYENGQVTTTAGSWEAGVNGALPGIIMLSDPKVDDEYRQEFLAGEAEDLARVQALDETVTVPFATFGQAWVTDEWTPLEPGVTERKWYAPGVGFVYQETIEGGSGSLSLVEVKQVHQ